MIIVSQDKTQILNFENVQNVRIEQYGTHIKGKKIYKIFAGNFEGYATELGNYQTEERAKEVLDEIVNMRGIFEMYKCSDNNTQDMADKWMLKSNQIFDIYEMPKE